MKLLVIYLLALANIVIAYLPIVKESRSKTFSHSILHFDESSNIAVALSEGGLRMSFDDGAAWKDINTFKGVEVRELASDPYKKERAFAFTESPTQYYTVDKGKTWKTFEIKDKSNKVTLHLRPKVVHNVANSDLILFRFAECKEGHGNQPLCQDQYFYTKNGLAGSIERLPVEAQSCYFMKSSKEFFYDGPDETIICAQNERNSFGHVVKSRLITSSDFFKTSAELPLASEPTDHGVIVDVRVKSSFLLVMVQNDKFNENSVVSLLVSKDGKSFDKSNLNVSVAYADITYLSSTPLSIFLQIEDVKTNFRTVLSSIWSSDSSGLNFEKIIDKAVAGILTERVEQVEGVWLTSVLLSPSLEDDSDPSSDLGDLLGNHKLVSKISIDDGKTWSPLRVEDDSSCTLEDGCSLHLASIDIMDGQGKFTTGPTANILVGIGNTGEHTKAYEDMSTYVSRDGGVSWKLAHEEACLYAFGDHGNIILAIPYYEGKDEPAKKALFSLDQGNTWQESKLETPFYPISITTSLDGSSSKLLITGLLSGEKEGEITVLYDFSNAFGGKKCDHDKDMEQVFARVSPEYDNKPLCIYGRKESFQRRKPDAQCLVKELFEDVRVEKDPCECNDADFECSKYFQRSLKGDACVPNMERIKEKCKSSGAKSVKLPDKQIVIGNECKLTKDISLFVHEAEFKCDEVNDGKTNEKILAFENQFEGELAQYAYVKSGPNTTENLLVRSNRAIMYASNNGGNSFTRIPVHEKIIWFTVGPVPGTAILITKKNIFYYSDDGGNTFRKSKAPGPAAFLQSRGFRPTFHPRNRGEFLWYTTDGCNPTIDFDCKISVHHTKDNGLHFSEMHSDVSFCDFIALDGTPDNLVYCLTGGSRKKLLSSQNYFQDEQNTTTLFEDVASYAIKDHFVVVGVKVDNDKEMRAKVTVDGSTFADADFPKDFRVEAQTAYNILDSGSHSIFMHVTTDRKAGREAGAILKSNSNGTSYILSLSDVNRGPNGYVDYDRVKSMEGVIFANIIGNKGSSDIKRLKTVASFNDGSQWSLLAPPALDSEGKRYECSGQPLEKCLLQLQGYTERPDFTDTYSSNSAIGLLFGVGNVGESLSKDNLATFLSTDGGILWKEVVKGAYMWEFGDSGTILVLVKQFEETDTLLYSADQGNLWREYKFSDKKVAVLDLANVPTDTGMKFAIFGAQKSNLHETFVFGIDFTHFYQRQCAFDLDHPEKDDYEYWTPKHPFAADNCLFGHEAKYLRRASRINDCFIGKAPLSEGFKVLRNCTCTREDYECDYNFFRDTDGTCKLVKGLTPADRKKEMCGKPDVFQYFEPTGYRKIPLSTCVGGKGFDTLKAQACPGHEKEFNEFYGRQVSGGKLLFLIFVPLLIFVCATWFVYDRGIKRNGGFRRFGQIRLDDDDDFDPIEENSVDVVVNKIVKGGIVTVAGTIALLKTIRKFDKALMDRIAAMLFGRRPGRRNYVSVPDEEDELFGTFEDNYEDESQALGDDDFVVQDEPEEFSEYAEEPARDADERLFNIDEHSDEEGNRESH